MAAARATNDDRDSGMEQDAQKLQLNCVNTKAETTSLASSSPSASATKSSLQADQLLENIASTQASVSNGDNAELEKELVDLKIIWNKNKYDLRVPLDSTGAELKRRIHSITGLPPAMQKVMFKRLLPEEKTLREIKVTSGAKIMVVGSTINDVLHPKRQHSKKRKLKRVKRSHFVGKSNTEQY